MSEVKKLFPELSEDAEYLLGKVIELYECEECCCPLSEIYLKSPGILAARCASAKCGKFEHSFSAHDPEIPQIAAKSRWDLAVEEQERRQGRWWHEVWFCAPRGH